MEHPDSSAAEGAFYAAFSALDIEAMREVWAQDSEAYCIHPGGPALRGAESIIKSWGNILVAKDPPSISYRTIDRNIGEDLAIHLVEESIRPSQSLSDPPSLVLATNIYVRSGSGWKMLVHHASLPLVREKPDPEARALH